MTQEQKDLLLKDLCARSPYGVKVLYENEIFNVEYVSPMYEEIKLDNHETWTLGIDGVKPYLFPLSSMTEEQQINLTKYLDARVFIKGEISFQCLYANTMDRWKRVFEWCLKNHFDIYGLIPMNLAINATGKNIY